MKLINVIRHIFFRDQRIHALMEENVALIKKCIQVRSVIEWEKSKKKKTSHLEAQLKSMMARRLEIENELG